MSVSKRLNHLNKLNRISYFFTLYISLFNFSHCLRGTISCTGPPCADFEPLRACKQTGWTPWLNTPAFVGGDYEVLTDPRLKATLEDYCGIANMTEIDCRVVETKQPFKETGQRVNCRLPLGLSCNDDEQKDSVCQDYEIRVYCDCGKLHTFDYSILKKNPLNHNAKYIINII